MFIEVSVTDESGRAEALSDALLAAGALSAAIEDADAGHADEDALYGEPGSEPPAAAWRRSRVVALFDGGVDVDAALAEAFAEAGIHGRPAVTRRDVADANWVTLTQSQFEPIAIGGGRVWIVPSWHETPPAAAGAVVLKLDPGMAFGTGDHPTTRLCLRWLAEHITGGETLIDYGCGSGILAIAARKLGSGDTVGTDIDDQAVAAARANASDNGVEVDFASSRTFTSAPVDIVMANILSNPLKVLAPLLTSFVAPGGRLVLSGVLERQWQEVAATYAPAIALDVWSSEAGWVCLAGSRTIAAAGTGPSSGA